MACVRSGGVVTGTNPPYAQKGDTWPKIISYNHRQYGSSRRAMRYKRHGIWQPITWTDYYLDVKYLSLGLLSLGFSPADKLLIIGDNAPQWYCAELAAQSNHGIAVAAGSDLTAAEVKQIARNSECSYAVVEDQEQVDKLLEIRDELPLMKKVIYWNYKGLSHYRDPLLVGYREVLQEGREFEQEHREVFETNVESGRAGDACVIIYTPGTAGIPKGAVHTHASMMANALSYLRLDPWYESDNIAPFLPPVWAAEQWFSVGCHLLSGCIMNLAEAPETRVRDAREVKATIAFQGARVWESRAAALQADILDSQGIGKLAFRAFMPGAYRFADLTLQGRKRSILGKVLHSLGNLVIFGRMRERLGLSRVRIAYSHGAVLSAEALRFYRALGVPLKISYTTTEGGVLTDSAPGDVRTGTVGRPFPDAEIKTGDDGELIYRQPGCFAGYYGDPDQTSGVLESGWFRSGDAAFVDGDGRLVFMDRLRSLIETKDAGKVSPQAIESRLRSSPYIRDAWVVGRNRSYLAAIVVMNYSTVAKWAGQRRMVFNTFGELSQTAESEDLVDGEIRRTNAGLPKGSAIAKFVNLPREFDPDRGELTRTGNLRRHVLENHLASVIEAIYAGETEVSVEAQARYRDGREELRRTTLSIRTVEGART